MTELTVSPTRGRRADGLLEATQTLRRALLAIGEHLPDEWPETAAEELARGSTEGFVAEERSSTVGLALYSPRRARAYGHAHVGAATDPGATAMELLQALVPTLPPTVDRLDVGVTGLAPGRAEELVATLRTHGPWSVIERHGLDRPLASADPPVAADPPPGYEFLPASAVALDTLSAVDWRAFQGSPDASFLAEDPAGDREMIDRVLEGKIGRFLDEASFAARSPEGQLAGFVLAVEENPQRALLADLAVDPAHRRRGLGRALLTRSLRALVALGYGTARLWVTEGNEPARALYVRSGFGPGLRSFIARWTRPRTP